MTALERLNTAIKNDQFAKMPITEYVILIIDTLEELEQRVIAVEAKEIARIEAEKRAAV